MQITFDETKDEQNRCKHGVSLSEAAKLKWDDALTWPDNRRNYGEARMVALAAMGARLYCVVYVDHEDARRIISLRKTNNREKKLYVSHD